MKKVLVLCMLAAILVASCAEKKTFKKADGTEFVAEPYGWMNKEKAIEGVEYELCKENVVISAFSVETLAVPVLLTGLELYQPVSYVEPNKQ